MTGARARASSATSSARNATHPDRENSLADPARIEAACPRRYNAPREARRMRRSIARIPKLLLLSCLCLFAAAPAVDADQPPQITVAAAISLKDALDEIAKAYEARQRVHVSL